MDAFELPIPDAFKSRAELLTEFVRKILIQIDPAYKVGFEVWDYDDKVYLRVARKIEPKEPQPQA